MKPGFLAMLLVTALHVPVVAAAHARLKASSGVVPRSTNAGIKVGPCGGLARGTPAVLQAGSTLTVTWEETINHPGRYEFYFSSGNDSNFVLLKSIEDDKDGTNDLPHQYSTQLTLPSSPCSACTLQMVQVMTENPASPSLYYSCADIQLVGGAATPLPAKDECSP